MGRTQAAAVKYALMGFIVLYEILDMFFNRQVLVICQDWLASTMR